MAIPYIKKGEITQKQLAKLEGRLKSQGIVQRIRSKYTDEQLQKSDIQRKKMMGGIKKDIRRLRETEGRVSSAKRKFFRREDTRKAITARAKAVSGIARATGIIAGKQVYSGPGRPRGTYKYGMPIHVYKEMLRQKRGQYEQFQQERMQRLAQQGFNPQQIQQLQQQETIEQVQMPQQMPMQAQETMEMPSQTLNRPVKRYAQDMPFRNVSDDELEFARWRAEKTIHPNTQRMLENVRKVQLMGKTANIEQQRRNRERNMLAKQMNLMKAHENMTDVKMDFTGVYEDNILFAPSVFKENPENNILKPRGTSILNTREGGNDLSFW